MDYIVINSLSFSLSLSLSIYIYIYKQRDCLLGLNVIDLLPSAHLSYFSPLFFPLLLHFFLHYIPPFNFSGVNSLRSFRWNRSFSPFLTINMPTVSLNVYVLLAINKFLNINNLSKYIYLYIYIYIYIYICVCMCGRDKRYAKKKYEHKMCLTQSRWTFKVTLYRVY